MSENFKVLTNIFQFLQDKKRTLHQIVFFGKGNDVNMATFQLMSMLAVFLFYSGGLVDPAASCHPLSKELHICLNIYLERDMSFVDTILDLQQSQSRYGGGRILLDDTDLHRICKDATGLEDCYKSLVGECDSYWQFYRFWRLMYLFRTTYTYLCSNSTRNLRDILLNAKCLTRSESLIGNCSRYGFTWAHTWKEVLRMQVDPVDRCLAIEKYKTCLVDQLQKTSCGQEAAKVYGNLLEVWLLNWCLKGVPDRYSQNIYEPAISASNRLSCELCLQTFHFAVLIFGCFYYVTVNSIS